MVKLKRIIQDFPVTRKAICSLYCTSIDDFSGDYEVEGLPTDYTVDIGSEAITKDFDLLQLTEDGWVQYGAESGTKSAPSNSKSSLDEGKEDIKEDVKTEESIEKREVVEEKEDEVEDIPEYVEEDPDER